jgi:hypothetical protein
MLQSCQNCWFNGLQDGVLGLPVGFCTRHRKILNAADVTTCGQQRRKDLSLSRARQVAAIHAARYPQETIVRIHGENQAVEEVSADERDLALIMTPPIPSFRQDAGIQCHGWQASILAQRLLSWHWVPTS